MEEIKNPAVRTGEGIEEHALNVVDTVPQSEHEVNINDETFGGEEDERHDVTAETAPAIVVPQSAKAAWIAELTRRAMEMMAQPKGDDAQPALAPVRAGQVLVETVPIRWLGDYMMVYIPELGHWAPAKYLLTQMLTEFIPTLRPTYGLRQVEEILKHAGVQTPNYTEGDQPNRAELLAKTWDAQPFITFANGDLHVPSMRLLPHSADHRTTWGVPFDWDPKAQSAKLDAFLRSAIPDDVSRKNYLAFVGYALARYDTSQHSFVYLKGHGSNGKSLALKLDRRLFGAYWSNTSLGKLVGSRFGATNLVFSALNFVGDQDAVFLSTTELLKELTGFDAIEAERKFRDAFPFVAKTKFMFAVNGLPKVKDVSHGFFRRPLIVEFPTQFRQNAQYEQSLLTDDTVVQALAVHAIEAYREMLKHGGFWIEGRTKELIDEYRADNDVVFDAVKNGLIYSDPFAKIVPWSLTPLINLYGAEQQRERLSQSVILERLGHAGITCTKKRESHGARERYIHGIGVDADAARALVNRAAIAGMDGRSTVNIGNRRVDTEELLDAWGVDKMDAEPTVSDPDIVQIFGGGESTWI